MFQSKVIQERVSFRMPREAQARQNSLQNLTFYKQSFWRTDFVNKFMNLYKTYINKLEFKEVMVENKFRDLGNFLSTAEIKLKIIVFDKIKGLNENDINLLIINVSKLQSLEELRMSRMGIKGPKIKETYDDVLIGRCVIPATQVIQ